MPDIVKQSWKGRNCFLPNTGTSGAPESHGWRIGISCKIKAICPWASVFLWLDAFICLSLCLYILWFKFFAKASLYIHASLVLHLGHSQMQEGTSLHLGKIHFVWEIIVLSYLSRTYILIRVAKIILREFNPNFGSTVSLEWIYCIRRTKSSLGGRERIVVARPERKEKIDWQLLFGDHSPPSPWLSNVISSCSRMDRMMLVLTKISWPKCAEIAQIFGKELSLLMDWKTWGNYRFTALMGLLFLHIWAKNYLSIWHL